MWRESRAPGFSFSDGAIARIPDGAPGAHPLAGGGRLSSRSHGEWGQRMAHDRLTTRAYLKFPEGRKGGWGVSEKFRGSLPSPGGPALHLVGSRRKLVTAKMG